MTRRTRRVRSGWDNRVWGVAFQGGMRRDGVLIGQSWYPREEAYPGEPSRALVFRTRALARAWCRDQMAEYAAYPEGHVCRAWRVRPVAVRELVEVVSPPRS